MNFWKKLQERKIRKHLAKLDKIDRLPEKIRLKYPEYEVGPGTYGTPHVRQFGNEGATLRIGAYTSIAGQVTILLGGNHRTDWVSNYPFPMVAEQARHITDYSYSKGDVVIGSDCWVGERVTITSGVTIGHGAVIAAGSVVCKDVEPYAIVGGNPCKLLRWRFDEPVRRQLLATQWWAWPTDEVLQVSAMLCSNDIDRFLVYARGRGAPVEGALWPVEPGAQSNLLPFVRQR